MKFAVSFLIFLLSLFLFLTTSTTQLLVFHFLFPLFSIPPSQQVFSLQIGKTTISHLFLNQKPLLHPLQTITQSLNFPSQLRFWNVTSLIICTTFVPLITSFLVSLVLLSIFNFWFYSLDLKKHYAVFFDLTKGFDSVPHKPLLDSLSLLNLPPLLLSWLHSYLQGHNFFSNFNVHCSIQHQSHYIVD